MNLGSSPKEGDGEGEKRKTGLSESRLAQYGGQQAATWQTSSCMRAGEGHFSPRKSGKAQNVQESKPRFCLVSGGKKEIEGKGNATLF